MHVYVVYVYMFVYLQIPPKVLNAALLNLAWHTAHWDDCRLYIYIYIFFFCKYKNLVFNRTFVKKAGTKLSLGHRKG